MRTGRTDRCEIFPIDENAELSEYSVALPGRRHAPKMEAAPFREKERKEEETKPTWCLFSCGWHLQSFSVPWCGYHSSGQQQGQRLP